MRIGLLHDAEVAGSFLVDVATGAITTDSIGTDSTMMLSEEVGEIA